jgi:hypothetical protein
MLLGIDGVTIAGTAIVDVNSTGMAINESLEIPGVAEPIDVVFATADRVTRFEALDVDLNIVGQALHGNFLFDEAGDGTLTIAASDVDLTLGDGTNGISITDASGALALGPAGTAGQLDGTLSVNLPDISLDGTFGIAVNSTGAPVNETFVLGGDNIELDLPAGPYLRIEGSDIDIDVAGQTLTGNVAVEQGIDADGATVLTVALSDVSLALGSADDTIISLDNGFGLFLVTDAGLAGRLGGAVIVDIPGDAAEISGTFTVEINTTNLAISEQFVVGGEAVTLEMDRSDALRIVGTGVVLEIAGQTLTADFAFAQVAKADGTTAISAAITNGSIDLGSGAVVVSNVEGALFLFADANGQQIAARLAADVDISIPGVDVDGTFGVSINTSTLAVDETFIVGVDPVDLDVTAGPILEVTGSATLTVLGQAIGGNFSITRTTDVATGASLLTIGITEGFLNLGGDLVTVTEVTGAFIVTDNGLGAVLAATVGLTLPNVDLSGSFELEINTTMAAIDQTVDVPDAAGVVTSVLVDLPAGPYLRLSVIGLSVNIAGQVVTGDFTIEDETQADGTKKTIVAIANAGIELAGGAISVTDGAGFFLVTSAGLAGSLAATITLDPSLGVTFTGTFGVEINTTSVAVDESIQVGLATNTLELPAGPYLQISGENIQLAFGDQSLTGDFSIQQFTLDDGTDATKVAASNVSLAISDGTTDLLTISNGSGSLLIVPAGLAGVIEGTVGIGVPGASLAGTLRVEINQLPDAVEETFFIAGATTTLDLPAGEFVRVKGEGIALTLGGIEISGNFTFTSATDAVSGDAYLQVEFDNGELGIGSGGTAFIRVTNAAGLVVAKGDDLWGTFTGDVAVDIPTVEIDGTFTISVNTSTTTQSVNGVDVDPGFRIEVAGPTLEIAGITIGATKVTIEQDAVGDAPVLSIVVENLAISFDTFVTASVGLATIVITDQGVGADISGIAVSATLPGTDDFTATGSLRINTSPQPFNLDDPSLELPGGPSSARSPSRPTSTSSSSRTPTTERSPSSPWTSSHSESTPMMTARTTRASRTAPAHSWLCQQIRPSRTRAASPAWFRAMQPLASPVSKPVQRSRLTSIPQGSNSTRRSKSLAPSSSSRCQRPTRWTTRSPTLSSLSRVPNSSSQTSFTSAPTILITTATSQRSAAARSSLARARA